MAEEDRRLQSDREGHALDASAPSADGLDESTTEASEPKRGIEWREILRQAFKKAQQAQQAGAGDGGPSSGGASGGGAPGSGSDKVVDADFEEVDDQKKRGSA